MKKLILGFLIASFYLACAPTINKSVTKSTDSEEKTISAQESLAFQIEKLPGVRVYRNSGYYTVNAGKVGIDSKPLFVVNGVDRGRNFNVVSQLIQYEEIKSVRLDTDLLLYYKQYPDICAAILIATK